MRFFERKSSFLFFSLIAWGVIVYLVARDLIPEKIFFTQDLATSFGVSRAFLNGELLLLGPPSHVGGRHLGPYYYWTIVFSLLVAGGDTYRAVIVLVILNLTSLLLLIFILRKFFSGLSLYGALCGLGGTVLGSKFPWVLRDPWHANMVFLFSSVFVFSFYKTLERGKWYFPFMILSGAVLGQMHFSSAPLVIGFGAVALLSLYKLPQRDKVTRREKLFSLSALILTCFSFTPLLIYELRFGSVIEPLFSGLNERSEFSIDYLSLFAHIGRYFGDYTPFHAVNLPVLFHTRELKILYCISGVLLSVSWFYVSSLRKKYFAGGVLLSLVLYAVSLRHAPDLYNYYLNALLPVVALVSSIGIGFSIKCALQIKSEKYLAGISIVFSTLFFLFAYENFIKTSKVLASRPIAHWHTLETSTALADAIKADNASKEPFTLVTQGVLDISREAVFYELGQEYFDEYRYREVFREIPYRPESVKNAQLGYSMYAPRTDWLGRKSARRHRKEGWIDEQELSLQHCKTCSNCDLIRLRARGVAHE